MSIRKILVPVDGTPAARPVLETAFAVGRHLAAHVEALHVRPDPRDAIPLVGEGMSGAMIEELITITEEEGASRAAKARAMFDEVREAAAFPTEGKPSSTGLSAAWREETGREDEATVHSGRLADLVVVGRPTAQAEAPSRMTFNAALFETGRPVLVAPLQTVQSIGRTIAIAWSGSAEASRAVAAALPFIERADASVILSIASDDTAGTAGTELADYLAWHGLAAGCHTVSGEGVAVGEALLKACAGVDLLVMGAYTHSRLRQLILGGTTRHVLEQAAIPLLMAH
jgi:nucleotide-binding universal stress UspA family protein